MATWVEHWVNGLLLAKALAAGCSHEAGLKLLRKNLPIKLDRLWRQYGLPPFSNDLREALRAMARTRNDYVHYYWEGQDPDALRDSEDRLRVAAANGRNLIERLVDFELDAIRAAEIAAASSLFDISVRALLRERALPHAT